MDYSIIPFEKVKREMIDSAPISGHSNLVFRINSPVVYCVQYIRCGCLAACVSLAAVKGAWAVTLSRPCRQSEK